MGLLAGDVVATTAAYAELSPYVKSSKLKTLAVMSNQRIKQIPDVPTMKEAGYDLVYSTWRGLAVPRDTPSEIVDKWRVVAEQVSQAQSFKFAMETLTLTVSYTGPEEFCVTTQSFKPRVFAGGTLKST